MYIDEAEPIIGLVQLDVMRFVGRGVVDGKGGLVVHVDGKGRGRGRRGEVFGNLLLHPVVLDDVVTGAE